MKKRRDETGSDPKRKPSRRDRDMVETLTAAGLNGDSVAAVLGLNKNMLRSRHALALANGRAAMMKRKAEARAAKLTSEERFALDAIMTESAIDLGDLWPGLGGGGARSPADAFARWLRDGSRYVCTGLEQDKFTSEQLDAFAQVKAEAKKLLLKARQ